MFRKTVSLTLFLSGLLVLATSVVMYYQPEGRVAYWADWHFWGLTKEQWGDIHITTGFLFLLALIAHVWLNFRAMVAYLKNKARDLVVLTRPAVFALGLTAFVTVGTLLGWPPMRQVLSLGAWFKESHAQTFGLPPYGHAELTGIEAFCRQMGLDYEATLKHLTDKGIAVGAKTAPLKEIAAANKLTPQALYEAMTEAGTATRLPPEPPSGFGTLSLETVVSTYGLDTAAVSREFAAAGLVADPAKSIKDIAAAGGRQPREVYGLLQAAAKAAPAPTPTFQPEKGLGRMTLDEAAAAYGLDAAHAREVLSARKVVVTPEATIRDLAEAAGMGPHELLELLRQ